MDRARLRAIVRDAGDIIWRSRRRLLIGIPLLVINRLTSLVLPGTAKYLIDDVIGKHRADLLVPLALAAGAATIVDAISGFALSQVLGVAAQHAIAEMRKSMQMHVTRLPVRYFDSTQTGVLISRVMNSERSLMMCESFLTRKATWWTSSAVGRRMTARGFPARGLRLAGRGPSREKRLVEDEVAAKRDWRSSSAALASSRRLRVSRVGRR